MGAEHSDRDLDPDYLKGICEAHFALMKARSDLMSKTFQPQEVEALECEFEDDPIGVLRQIRIAIITRVFVDAEGVDAVLQKFSDFSLDHFAFLARDCFIGSDFSAECWEQAAEDMDLSHRLIVERVGRYLEDGQRVLDLGCGTGLSSLPLLEQQYGIALFGVDASNKMLDRFLESATMMLPYLRDPAAIQIGEMDLNKNPKSFMVDEEEKLDHVLSNGVLHYVEDLDSVFAAVAGDLKDGGYFHFSLPIEAGSNNEFRLETGKTVVAERYIRHDVLNFLCSREEVMTLLNKHGFELVEESEHFVHREPGMQGRTYFTYFTARKYV